MVHQIICFVDFHLILSPSLLKRYRIKLQFLIDLEFIAKSSLDFKYNGYHMVRHTHFPDMECF